jgi:hypothetical protein
MDNFIQKANKIHNNKYDYTKVDYKNNHTKVTIICPEHGEFQQSPMAHLMGCEGCKDCQKINENKKREKNREKNEENFLKKATEKHNNKYDYSKIDYKKNSTKVIIVCPVHGEFEQAPSKHLSSQGCPKCSGQERNIDKTRFIEKAVEKHGTKYDYTNINYEDYSTPIEIYCPKHDIFRQLPSTHCLGTGCPKCGREVVEEANRSNTEEFIQKAKKIHGNKYDYSKVEYKNNSTKVTIICPVHGEFEQAPSNHLAGKGCCKCGRKVTEDARRSNTEEFIQKAKEVHGDKYDYSKSEYTGNNNNVIIICKEHGEFEQTPHNHLKSQNCPTCAKIICSNKLKLTKEEFIKKSREVHGDKYDYSLVDYVNSNTHVIIICPKHGNFKQKPYNHYNKGCPICKCCPNCLLFQTNGRLCSYCKPQKNNKLYQKTKEYKVVEYMRNNIDKDFVHNKSVGSDCTKNDRENTNGHLYPDLRWDCVWFHLILEVDEFQHRGAEYKCDERRMVEILSKLGMPCVFIRYNPDSKESNLEVLENKIKSYLEEEYNNGNSKLQFDPFIPLITEYLYYNI